MNVKQQAMRMVLAAGLFFAATAVRAESDEGAAANSPWSGYWWQHSAGGLTAPLTKYDALLSTQAAQWERDTHLAGAVQDWFGYCHAWSAAAICEREPRDPRTVKDVTFGVGDQKGLLTACHAQDVTNSYGDRYGDGGGSEDLQDIYPDELWKTLQMYVKEQRVPIVLDLDPGDQVWNYPVYQYRVDYEPAGDGWYDCTMQLVCADDNVEPDFLGTQPLMRTYTFRVRFESGAIVSGSGQWTGESVTDHPDFAWYPYVAVAENPEINLAEVAKIVGYPVGGNNPPTPDNPTPDDPPKPEPPQPDPPKPEPPPQPEPPQPEPPQPEPPKPEPPPVPVQDTLSIDELIKLVLNRSSAFVFDITVDKFDGGRYQVGEPVRVQVRSAQAGYLYLFDIDAQGELQLVFPLSGQPNAIEKNTDYVIPAADQAPWFLASTPGQHDLKGIITTRPILVTGFRTLPQSQQGQLRQLPPGQQAPEEVRKTLTAHPPRLTATTTTVRRVRGGLIAGLRKGDLDAGKGNPNAVKPKPNQDKPGQDKPSQDKPSQDQPAAKPKVWPFAQDLCSYFVLPGPPPGKVPAQQTP